MCLLRTLSGTKSTPPPPGAFHVNNEKICCTVHILCLIGNSTFSGMGTAYVFNMFNTVRIESSVHEGWGWVLLWSVPHPSPHPPEYLKRAYVLQNFSGIKNSVELRNLMGVSFIKVDPLKITLSFLILLAYSGSQELCSLLICQTSSEDTRSMEWDSSFYYFFISYPESGT